MACHSFSGTLQMVESNIVLAGVLLSVVLQIIYNVFGRGVQETGAFSLPVP